MVILKAKIMNKVLFILSILICVACKQEQIVKTVTEGDTSYAIFGEKLGEGSEMDVPSVVSELATKDSLNVKITGVVKSVCKKKGCWANIVPENAEAPEMFVKFKDYGFFLPLDCEGQKVIMEGKAFVNMTPVDELRHYAEDEGKSAEEIAAITEPKKEYQFLASGVRLMN